MCLSEQLSVQLRYGHENNVFFFSFFFCFNTVGTETTCDVLTQSLKLGRAKVTSRKNRCTRAFLADSRLSGS